MTAGSRRAGMRLPELNSGTLKVLLLRHSPAVFLQKRRYCHAGWVDAPLYYHLTLLESSFYSQIPTCGE